MTPCEHCGRDTPDQAFCIWCGAHRTEGIARPQDRHHHYAVQPGEHVAQPSPVTTLFPHLPSHRVHEFRWALIGGLGVVVLLVATGLIVAAILAAAVLVPVLYLVYLYETQVYRDEPAKVLGLTIGAGVVLGVVVSVVADHLIQANLLLSLHETTGMLLATTLLLPCIQEVVKIAPVLTLRRFPAFPETIDGLVFGVACGLGFTAAQTIVDFSKVIANQPVHASSANWIFPVLTIAVLNPLVQGSCTGMLAAATWRLGKGRLTPVVAAGIPLAFGFHIAFSLVTQLLSNHGVAPAIVIAWQAAVVAGALVFIRFLVHRSLLEEAIHLGLHPVICPSCRRHVATAAFCPDCGAAVTASPRQVAGAPSVPDQVDDGVIAAAAPGDADV